MARRQRNGAVCCVDGGPFAHLFEEQCDVVDREDQYQALDQISEEMSVERQVQVRHVLVEKVEEDLKP